MDKLLLRQQVLDRLSEDLQRVEHAVREAHEAATHEENIAENKYDTLGLEAAYLATGQARRADAIRQAFVVWSNFSPLPYNANQGIQLGAVVRLADAQDNELSLFLGPEGGNMTIESCGNSIYVVSSQAPLAKSILGKCVGDEVSLQVGSVRKIFEVLSVG